MQAPVLRRAALYFCTEKSVSVCTFVPVDFAEAFADQRIPFLEVELVTVKSLRSCVIICTFVPVKQVN